MSQRSEKLTRRLEHMSQRLDRLEGLRSGDFRYHNQQLSYQADTHREQTTDLRHLRTEVADLRRGYILRDIIVVCLIGLLIAGLFSVRSEVRAIDKHAETRAVCWVAPKEGRAMAYYHTCPDCGAHLDAGEHCDCKEKTASGAGTSESGGTDQNGQSKTHP